MVSAVWWVVTRSQNWNKRARIVEAGGSCAPPPHPLLHRHSKISIAGWLKEEVGPWSDKSPETTYLSCSKSGRPSPIAPWRLEGEWCQATHRPLHWNPSWLRDALGHVGRSWVKPNTGSGPDKWKWLAKGNPEEMPHVNGSNYQAGATLWVSTRTYAFPANKRVLCFITFCLHGNLFLQSWRARTFSLTISLGARIQYSHRGDPTSISGGERKPTSSRCRSKPPKIIFGAETQEFKVNLGLHPAAAWGHWLSLLLSFSHSPFHFQDLQGIISVCSTLRMTEGSPRPCRFK